MLETQYMDRVGRIRIPMKIARKLKFIEKDQALEITLEYGKICIRKFEPVGFEKKKNVGMIRILVEKNRIIIPVDYRNLLDISQTTPISGDVDYETGTIRFWKAS